MNAPKTLILLTKCEQLNSATWQSLRIKNSRLRPMALRPKLAVGLPFSIDEIFGGTVPQRK
jgi:hypothetical protein